MEMRINDIQVRDREIRQIELKLPKRFPRFFHDVQIIDLHIANGIVYVSITTPEATVRHIRIKFSVIRLRIMQYVTFCGRLRFFYLRANILRYRNYIVHNFHRIFKYVRIYSL